MGVLPAERGREAGEMSDIMHGRDFMIGARSTPQINVHSSQFILNSTQFKIIK